MTREETKQALDWFRNRSKTVTMPGAKRMYLLAIEALSADGDTISRQAAIDICANAIDIWHGQLGEGALIAVRDKIKELPPAHPEPCEDDPRADVYYLAEKIGIHQLYALVVQLRGEPEPCEDAVSRKAVIDTIDEWKEACADSGHKETVSDIMLIRKDFIELPPAHPEPCEDAVSRKAVIEQI